MTRRQRDVAGDKLADLANLTATGLVFGQAIAGVALSIWSITLAIAGVVIWLTLACVVGWLLREE